MSRKPGMRAITHMPIRPEAGSLSRPGMSTLRSASRHSSPSCQSSISRGSSMGHHGRGRHRHGAEAVGDPSLLVDVHSYRGAHEPEGHRHREHARHRVVLVIGAVADIIALPKT